MPRQKLSVCKSSSSNMDAMSSRLCDSSVSQPGDTDGQNSQSDHVLPSIGMLSSFRMPAEPPGDYPGPPMVGTSHKTLLKETKLSPLFLERLRHKYASDSEYAEKKREYSRRIYERNKEKCRERARLHYHRQKLLKNSPELGEAGRMEMRDLGQTEARAAGPSDPRGFAYAPRASEHQESHDQVSHDQKSHEKELCAESSQNKRTKLSSGFLERLRNKYATDTEFAERKREHSRRTYHRHKEKYLERAKLNYERQKQEKRAAEMQTPQVTGGTPPADPRHSAQEEFTRQLLDHDTEQHQGAPPEHSDMQTEQHVSAADFAERKREYMRNRYKTDADYRARRCEEARKRYSEKIGGIYSRKSWKQTIAEEDSCETPDHIVRTRLIDIIKKNLDEQQKSSTGLPFPGFKSNSETSYKGTHSTCSEQRSDKDTCTEQTFQDACIHPHHKDIGKITTVNSSVIDWPNTALHRMNSPGNHSNHGNNTNNPASDDLQSRCVGPALGFGLRDTSCISSPVEGSAFRYTGQIPATYPNLYSSRVYDKGPS